MQGCIITVIILYSIIWIISQILRAVQQQQADFRDFKEDTLNKIDDMAEQVRSLQEERSTPKSSRKIKLPTNASVS